MSLSLVKRSTNGAPVSAVQNDANMTAIESAVNTDVANLANSYTSTTGLNAMFASQSAGKQQIDWANVTGKPGVTSQRYPFSAIQAASVTVSSSSTTNLSLGTELFDPGNAFASGTFTAPVTGYYQFNYSIQVGLASGTPTAITIIASLNKNGSGVDDSTMDVNTNTGERIYKGSALISCAATDTITLSIAFSFSGTASWTIANNSNTALSGFLVQ